MTDQEEVKKSYFQKLIDFIAKILLIKKKKLLNYGLKKLEES